MKEKIELRAVSAPWHHGVELLVRQGNSYGTNIILDPIKKGAVAEPTMRIDMDAAQSLMDDLWNAGLRPTEGAGSAGSLRATENHLSDMRKIAFKKLSIDS